MEISSLSKLTSKIKMEKLFAKLYWDLPHVQKNLQIPTTDKHIFSKVATHEEHFVFLRKNIYFSYSYFFITKKQSTCNYVDSLQWSILESWLCIFLVNARTETIKTFIYRTNDRHLKSRESSNFFCPTITPLITFTNYQLYRCTGTKCF